MRGKGLYFPLIVKPLSFFEDSVGAVGLGKANVNALVKCLLLISLTRLSCSTSLT